MALLHDLASSRNIASLLESLSIEQIERLARPDQPSDTEVEVISGTPAIGK